MKILNYRIALIILSFLLFNSVFSQKRNYFNVDLGLSQTYKGFFYLFDGVVDIGAGYNRHIIDQFYGGFSFHLDYLSRSGSSARTIVYKPKVNLGYDINVSSRFSINPMIFAGYSFLNLSNKEFNYTENQNGINCGGEIRLVWNTGKRLDYFIFGRYDYIYLTEDKNFTHLEYYRRVHLTSFGIGVKIKSRQESRFENQDLRD